MPVLLKAVLVATGAALILISLNTALGGMMTLGWQFPGDAASVANDQNFARHDSNARFFAGVFCGLSLTTIAAAFWPGRLRMVVAVFMLSITLGGVFRLLQGGYSPIWDMALLPSLVAELVLAPLLALWVLRATR